ncbi:ribonuclease H-like domain-containing protein [Tanacetum coccineum]|uniref:Ribonuclease H-like domain-containing protein n=1 Tax=Tanacetum coccineum TaxID=301880 RepID=A0ABQ4Z7T9_9ASTR
MVAEMRKRKRADEFEEIQRKRAEKREQDRKSWKERSIVQALLQKHLRDWNCQLVKVYVGCEDGPIINKRWFARVWKSSFFDYHCVIVMSDGGDSDTEGVADPVTLISKLDVSNPLHLHSNDSAVLTVVSVKLKGTENYQVWANAMLLSLEGKNKIGFIDGTCRKSMTDDVLAKQWDRVNAVVLGWILNSISEELFLGQIFSKKAKHVWKELKETYHKVDGSVIFNLHHKINTIKQNGSELSGYYHKLNALWKQYDAMVELPNCLCAAASDFKKHNQLLKLMQFLMGLDDSYMSIRSSILSRETLPDVKIAYAIISSEESHRMASGSVSGHTQRTQTSAFMSKESHRMASDSVGVYTI